MMYDSGCVTVSVPNYPPLGGCSKPAPPDFIPERLARVRKLTEELGSTLDVVIERLSGVLKPDQPSSVGADGINICTEVVSPISESIRQHEAHLHGLHYRLMGVLRRLDLP